MACSQRLVTMTRPAGLLAIVLATGCSGSIGGDPSEGGGSPSGPGGPGGPMTGQPGGPPATGGTGGGMVGGGGMPTGPEVIVMPPMPTSSACMTASAPRPGVAGLRRLTRSEYDNTVLELLNDSSAPGASFPADQTILGFDNNADAARPSTLLVEKYESTADRLATTVTQNLPMLMGCTPANAAAEDTCLRQFVETFGLRAYRRPLAKDEIDRYVMFYTTNKSQHGFAGAVKMVVQAMLQSPYFLYRVEGIVAPTAPGVVKVNPYEVATRLSYFIWASMPDKVLFDAAKAGTLSTPMEVANQAKRMLDDARANRGVKNFFAQWLHLSAMDKVEKDATTFPKWKPTLGPLFKQETETFVEEMVLRGEGTLEALLKAPYSYMNRELATFHGVTGPTATTFQKVMLDATKRAGVLTQASFLASAAHPRQTNPVARGVFVREQILCSPPPVAPGAIPPFPEPDGRLSTRERLAMHRAAPACAACHALFDPLGFAFEQYDGIGLWRTTDAGKAIDATGEIVSIDGLSGTFSGAIELVDRIAPSKHVRECVAKEYFRYAFGRAEDPTQDQCTLEALVSSLMANGGSFKQLLTTLAQTDPFLYRTIEAGGI